jgi:hypothetical protein
MEKPKNPNRFNRLFENRGFQAIFGLVALALAYVFASWAIDSGSLLDYAITLLATFIGLRELVLAVFRKGR